MNEKLILKIQRDRLHKNKKMSRKERANILIKKGALFEMLGLVTEEDTYLVGLLLRHYQLNEDEKQKVKEIGERFYVAKQELNKKKEVKK
ncbi:hypothetical protein [Sneathia sanguinegens]|uniref:hypothetical protein n=1 Tax=Sneathia sanguinegens TaxID=40543 RepID=UPI002888FFCF|nr:hypothetical protein [Sneathia sanguinegens]